MASRVVFIGFSISSSFSMSLVNDWLRLGRFVMVIGIDSLILPMGMVFGIIGGRKGVFLSVF